jgi:hypothetical protein
MLFLFDPNSSIVCNYNLSSLAIVFPMFIAWRAINCSCFIGHLIKIILIQKNGIDSQMHLKVVQNVKVLKIQLSGVVKDFKISFFGFKKKLNENWKKCYHWKFILSNFNNIANCKFLGTQINFLVIHLT